MISSFDIADSFKEFISGGSCFDIYGISSIYELKSNTLTFSKIPLNNDLFKKHHNVLFIVSKIPKDIGDNFYIITDNPRLLYAKILLKFFQEKPFPSIGEHTVIDKSAFIGNNVVIGNNCTIGKDVIIGDNTEIRHNVVIYDNVKIGNNCLIKSNSVIGECGFGFEYDNDGTPVKILQLGGVTILNNVEIGSGSTIDCGTITDTIIHSNVKIDNLVHVAHNVVIKENVIITASSIISGGVIINKGCWIGVNSCIKEKTVISEHSLLGAGSVVIKDVSPYSVVVGNPAKKLKSRG